MAIYDPQIFLTKDDKELLRLLSELLVDIDGSNNRNWHSANVPLSDSENENLLSLLEQFVDSKKFQEGAYFIEKLFSSESLYDKTLRDIYLFWRRRLGKSRAVAAIQWENFLGRLGLWTNQRGNPNVWYRANAEPMDIQHFLQMEQKLAQAAGLNPRVRALIMRFVTARIATLDKIRQGEAKILPGQVKSSPQDLLNLLKTEKSGKLGVQPISTSKISGILTIVMDFSTLYTTRDWSVTSVLSATAGALPSVLLD